MSISVVKYNQEENLPQSEGRNGFFYTSAIELETYGNEVRLNGVTSKGYLGRGHISLPYKEEVIRETVSVLNGFLVEKSFNDVVGLDLSKSDVTAILESFLVSTQEPALQDVLSDSLDLNVTEFSTLRSKIDGFMNNSQS